MSSIMTKWSVCQDQRVTADDLDAEGAISDAEVGRWISLAREAYLGQCARLQKLQSRSGLNLRAGGGPHPAGARLGPATSVVVSATATEVLPEAFVIAVRLRPVRSDRDEPLNTTCVISFEHPATGESHAIGNDIRDELIALEHAARHFN